MKSFIEGALGILFFMLMMAFFKFIFRCIKKIYTKLKTKKESNIEVLPTETIDKNPESNHTPPMKKSSSFIDKMLSCNQLSESILVLNSINKIVIYLFLLYASIGLAYNHLAIFDQYLVIDGEFRKFEIRVYLSDSVLESCIAPLVVIGIFNIFYLLAYLLRNYKLTKRE